MRVFSRKKSVGELNVRLMGLNVPVEHNILCLSREGTARWQSASRLFSQYFRSKKYIYINDIAKCPEKLADYTFEERGQEKKPQIARYCVCRYLHTISTICSIDFELRHTFPPPKPAPICQASSPRELKLIPKTQFPTHARDFQFT
jgi:hypothetical protein